MRRGRLDNLEIVDLRGGDNVEGKGTGVGFARWDSRTVNPDVVVALRESANHDKFLVNNRDAWHTANHFRGILVLRTLNLLRGDTALHHKTVALNGHHSRFGIAGSLTRDRCHSQKVVGKAHRHDQERIGMLAVKSAFFLGVGNIVESEVKGLPLARAFQLEAARFVRCQSLVGFFHLDSCAQQTFACFCINHATANGLRGKRQSQCKHPAKRSNYSQPLPHV